MCSERAGRSIRGFLTKYSGGRACAVNRRFRYGWNHFWMCRRLRSWWCSARTIPAGRCCPSGDILSTLRILGSLFPESGRVRSHRITAPRRKECGRSWRRRNAAGRIRSRSGTVIMISRWSGMPGQVWLWATGRSGWRRSQTSWRRRSWKMDCGRHSCIWGLYRLYLSRVWGNWRVS